MVNVTPATEHRQSNIFAYYRNQFGSFNLFIYSLRYPLFSTLAQNTLNISHNYYVILIVKLDLDSINKACFIRNSLPAQRLTLSSMYITKKYSTDHIRIFNAR